MHYDFDQVIERRGTGSSKWDGAIAKYQEPDLLPLTTADMDFPVAEPIRKALAKRLEHPIFGYTLIGDGVYAAIASWLERRHGWKIDTQWISYTAGVVHALKLIVHAFSEPGDEVIVQSPVYGPFFHVPENLRRKVVFNPLQLTAGKYVMDYDDLASKISPRTKLLILCSPHNPVGRVWTQEELVKLAEVCLKHNIIIVSDEIHSDFIYPGSKHVPLASISQEIADRTITCIAPSKTFNLAGLATSAVVISNAELRKRFQQTLESLGGGYNLFGILALEAAYRHGEDWLEQLLDYLEGNRWYLVDFMAQELPDVQVVKPEGTYLAWLDFRALGLHDDDLWQLLLTRAKVALNPGIWFGPGGEGFCRLNFGCPRSVLTEALWRIKDAVQTV